MPIKKSKKRALKTKPRAPIAISSVSVSFERFDWEVIYSALRDKTDDLYQRRFHAAGGYPQERIDREMAYLYTDLMPRVEKLFKSFSPKSIPPKFSRF